MKTIYTYTDYRKYIWDYYLEQKILNKRFSYQSFADKAGLRSKTFIPKVFKREKALTLRRAGSVARAMGLGRKESRYFQALVSFNNAVEIDEKEFCLTSLLSLNKDSEFTAMCRNELYYYSKWYCSILYNIATTIPWLEKYDFLATLTDPQITAAQAKKAIKVMLELGIIKNGSDGNCEKTNVNLIVDNPIKEFAVKKGQMELIKLGINASLKNKGKTFFINGKISDTFKKMVYSQIFRLTDFEDRIYQVCVHVYPVSKV